MNTSAAHLTTRAEELLELARASGRNSIERELELLPEEDEAARIGYLANALGIDPGVAFDTEASLDAQEVV